jgi:hypothetical protein
MHSSRRALAGAALGAVIGTIVAVVYSRVQNESGTAGIRHEDAEPVDMSTVARTALLVLGTIRQILNFA